MDKKKKNVNFLLMLEQNLVKFDGQTAESRIRLFVRKFCVK